MQLLCDLQIVKNRLGTDSLVDNEDIRNLGVHIDSGLGVFDAFIASFSMILVSEVCAFTFFLALFLFAVC